jgi:AraC family transcriptional regulator, melibiose operon regulatory protein
MQSFDPSRADFEPYGFTCELWTAAPMKRPDRHNEIELNLMKNGALTYLFGGEMLTVPRGGLVAFWASIPHQIISSTGDREYYVVTVPLAWFIQCRLPTKLVDRLLHGHFLHDTSPGRFELDLLLFDSWTKDLTAESKEFRTATHLELHARLQRFAEALPETEGLKKLKGSSPTLGEGGLSKAERLAAYIAQNYRDPLFIEKVAKEVGLHPNYAMNLFKNTFNLTINEYLTQHRLSHAQRLLVTTEDKIIDIAMDAGYPTLSRFYEAFSKNCGCSPSRYRREHRVK